MIILGFCSITSVAQKKTEESNEVILNYNLQFVDNLFTEIDVDKFWKIIDYSRNNTKTKDEQIKLLINILSRQELTDISKFSAIFSFLDNKIYTSEMWAIPYFINDGCSDDSFAYFRAWLISEGKKKYTIISGGNDQISNQYSKKEEIFGSLEEFIDLGSIAIELKFPDNYDKLDEFEEMTDKYYSDTFKFKIPKIEFDWDNQDDIERLYPIFAKQFKE